MQGNPAPHRLAFIGRVEMPHVCTVDTPYPRGRTGSREIFDVKQIDPNILTPFWRELRFEL